MNLANPERSDPRTEPIQHSRLNEEKHQTTIDIELIDIRVNSIIKSIHGPHPKLTIQKWKT